MEELSKKMEKDVKHEVIKSAAINTAIGLSLNFIPVVGQALSALHGVISSIAGDYYEKKIQAEVEGLKNEIDALVKASQKRVAARESAVVTEEINRAKKYQGMQGWLDRTIKRVSKGVQKTAKRAVFSAKQLVTDPGAFVKSTARQVGKSFQETRKAGIKAVRDVTGKSGYDKAKERIGQIREQAKRDIARQEQESLAVINGQKFRNDVYQKALSMLSAGMSPVANDRVGSIVRISDGASSYVSAITKDPINIGIIAAAVVVSAVIIYQARK